MLVPIVFVMQVGKITQRLHFLHFASTGILQGSCFSTGVMSCYVAVYFIVFGAVFAVYMVVVGWIKTMVK